VKQPKSLKTLAAKGLFERLVLQSVENQIVVKCPKLANFRAI
jgi:hypothetical protein